MRQTLVVGERADVLLEALRQIEWKTGRDGMRHGSVRLKPDLAAPFHRALMRIEAELTIHDADQIGRPEEKPRTYEQRAADAVVALALRVAEAVSKPR